MSKIYKIGSVVCIVLLIIIAGYLYKEYREKNSFLNEVSPGLSVSEFQHYSQILEETTVQLANDTSTGTRYRNLLKRGEAYDKLGKLKLSRNDYETAISLDAEKIDAYKGLFEVKIRMQDNDGASETMLDILERNSSSPYLLRNIEFQEQTMGAGQDTIRDLYEDALVKSSKHISVIESYADYLERQGDLQAAKEQWQQAKEVNPDESLRYDAEINRINQSTQGQE